MYKYYKITYTYKQCEICANKFVVSVNHSKSKTKGRFCSIRCKSKYHSVQMTGNNNPRWQGGFYYKDSYKYIYAPLHPNANALGYVREHRICMEDKLKRFLSPQEVVHHIDSDKGNNNIENLELFCNQSKHALCHMEYRSRDMLGRIK